MPVAVVSKCDMYVCIFNFTIHIRLVECLQSEKCEHYVSGFRPFPQLHYSSWCCQPARFSSSWPAAREPLQRGNKAKGKMCMLLGMHKHASYTKAMFLIVLNHKPTIGIPARKKVHL